MFTKFIRTIEKTLQRFFLQLIRCYQFIRPVFGQHCRFYPSCSEYAKQSLELHSIKGLYFIIRRILRCHPFHRGGIDLVPERNKS